MTTFLNEEIQLTTAAPKADTNENVPNFSCTKILSTSQTKMFLFTSTLLVFPAGILDKKA